jgi:hypothetical protein
MGLLLLLLGVILVVYGAVSDPAIYVRSLGMNINLWWGAAMTLVGAVMLALARRAQSR